MDQTTLLAFLIDVLESQRLRYGIAGSHASMAYGESRLTNDIDVVVGLTLPLLAPFCAAFPFPEFYVSVDGARAAALKGGMFNIIHPESGLKIDVIVPTTDFDRNELARVIRRPALIGRDASFVTAEDIILKKMEAYQEGGSEKHLRDIAGVLKVLGPGVDTEYVAEWADRLSLTEIWRTITAKLASDRARG